MNYPAYEGECWAERVLETIHRLSEESQYIVYSQRLRQIKNICNVYDQVLQVEAALEIACMEALEEADSLVGEAP